MKIDEEDSLQLLNPLRLRIVLLMIWILTCSSALAFVLNRVWRSAPRGVAAAASARIGFGSVEGFASALLIIAVGYFIGSEGFKSFFNDQRALLALKLENVRLGSDDQSVASEQPLFSAPIPAEAAPPQIPAPATTPMPAPVEAPRPAPAARPMPVPLAPMPAPAAAPMPTAGTRVQPAQLVLITIPGMNTDGLRMFEFGKEVKKMFEAQSGQDLVHEHIAETITIFHVLTRFALSTIPKIVSLRLENVVKTNRRRKCTVVCHSFATYCFGSALLENPAIYLHNVVHMGAVLRRDFPWNDFVSGNGYKPRISGKVVNFARPKDWVKWIAFWVGGRSGAQGYTQIVSGRVGNSFKNGSHGAYQPNDVEDTVKILIGSFSDADLKTSVV